MNKSLTIVFVLIISFLNAQDIPNMEVKVQEGYKPSIQESVKLGIPIIAILDSNSNPDGIDYPIPGNDDARRSIDLYCNLIKETIFDAKKFTVSSEINKTEVENKKGSNKKNKTLAEVDREKLEKKFSKTSKKNDKKLN